MSLKLTFAAGAIFAALIWGRVFGNVVLQDPNGEQDVIALQISMLQKDADSSNVQTIAILDTLKGN